MSTSEEEWSKRLSEFLDGNNMLCLRIDRMVDIKIDPEDRKRLLDRMIREETTSDVKNLVNGLVVPNGDYYQKRSTAYELDMKSWGEKNNNVKPNETVKEKKLRVATAKLEEGLVNPVIQIYFRQFNFQMIMQNDHEREEWKSFYNEYKEFLLMGDTNKFLLKSALESNGILDIGYTIYKKEIIRFNLCPILPTK
jgi:hypothetical protein